MPWFENYYREKKSLYWFGRFKGAACRKIFFPTIIHRFNRKIIGPGDWLLDPASSAGWRGELYRAPTRWFCHSAPWCGIQKYPDSDFASGSFPCSYLFLERTGRTFLCFPQAAHNWTPHRCAGWQDAPIESGVTRCCIFISIRLDMWREIHTLTHENRMLNFGMY